MSNKSAKTGKIARSAMLFTLVTTLSLILSFVKESVLAYFYGTSAEMDAYTLAIQLPVTLFATISVAINTIVIPNYSNELLNNGKESANRYASNLITIFTIISLGLVAILVGFADPLMHLIAPGLSGESRTLAVTIFRVVTPTIIMTEIVNINTGVMNVYKSFVIPACATILLNIGYIISVFCFYSLFGIYAAVLASIIGAVVEFSFSVYARRRYMKYRYTFDLRDESTKKSFKMALPVCVGIGAAEINKVIDRLIASFLETGSISSLNYASKLSSAVSSLMIKAITTIAFPEFAESAAKNDKKALARKFTIAIDLYIFILLPIIIGGAYLNKAIIRVVFMRGSFSVASVGSTGPLFACYLVCLLFTSIRQAGSNYFYSLGDSKTPMRNSLIGIAVNLVLNIILSRFLQAFGLALATTIAAVVISVLILIDIKKNNEHIQYSDTIKTVFKCVVSTAVMFCALFVISKYMFSGFSFETASTLGTCIYLIAQLFVGAIVYVIISFVLKTPQMIYVYSLLKSKIGSRIHH